MTGIRNISGAPNEATPSRAPSFAEVVGGGDAATRPNRAPSRPKAKSSLTASCWRPIRTSGQAVESRRQTSRSKERGDAYWCKKNAVATGAARFATRST